MVSRCVEVPVMIKAKLTVGRLAVANINVLSFISQNISLDKYDKYRMFKKTEHV